VHPSIHPVLIDTQLPYLPNSILNLQKKTSGNHKDICGASDTGMGGKDLEGGDKATSNNEKLFM
jgi:hypothetical protein